jgi:sortase A
MRWSGKWERLLLVVGLILLAIYVGARIDRAVSSRVALHRFKTEQLSPANRAESVELAAAKPDFTLWAPKRIKEYEDTLSTHFEPAIGILRIPKIHVEVPVLDGTDELSLNRGVGRIAGTAGLGEDGNIGIAGHRDGFFRGLQDVGPGDTVQVVTPQRTEEYVIDRVVIVDPSDVSVLGPRPRPSLTLVTCYPFYFVGSAPKRYIVQASITDSGLASRGAEQLNARDSHDDHKQSPR